MKNAFHKTSDQAASKALFAGLAVVVLFGCGISARAEYSGGPETQSLRNPLIPGAVWSPAFQAPPEGQPPPIGDGSVPAPVTPGHLGAPMPPVSDVPLPPMGPMDKPLINQMLAPYLTPPPSTSGEDPGMIHDINGFQPPASVVNIQPQGGIVGSAPICRWGGQTTGDYGLPKSYGSQTTDFGQDIDSLPAVTAQGIQRSQAQDGPRPALYPGQMGNPTNRQANLAGAQTTQDLHGNRTLFKGATLRSRMTIAPY